ncbi:MAG: hypothetical protein V3571_02890 [Pseudodesulfovibrio sp.]
MIGRLLANMARRDMILVAFVLSAPLSGLVDALKGAEGPWRLAALSVAVFLALAWLTRQGRRLATLATVLLLLLEGSGFLYDGLSGLFGQDARLPGALLPLLVAAGAYLTWGALVLHREQRIRD